MKGTVGYQIDASSAFKAIFGRLDLPDEALAVTKPDGQAILRLRDSSEVDIGENTTVQVGAFNAVLTGNPNTLALNNGALHFNVRRPAGGQSNYKFVTATSQIAVRGTEGFLIAGPRGTQVVCVVCAPGDVTVQVGNRSFSLVSNQTLTILGNDPLGATTSITPNPTVNNPAINQFSGGRSPFVAQASGSPFDPTASLSGTETGVAGGIGAGTAGLIAGGAVAAGAIAVAATSGHSSTLSPTPPPTPAPPPTPTPPPTPAPPPTPTPPPTPAPNPGPLLLQISVPGASATFPVPFSWPFSQTYATGTATASCLPGTGISCNVTQSINGTTLSGTISGTIAAAGTFSVSASASGYTVPTTTFTIYGGVTPSVPSLSFTGSTPQPITIAQNPPGTRLSVTSSCVAGAGITVTPGGGPSPLTLTVTPVAAPPTAVATAACTLTIAGQGGTSASTATVPVNVTSTSIGVSTKKRQPL